MKPEEQKSMDNAKAELAVQMISHWEGTLNYYTKAVENGRCNECNEPLMFDEKETCEDCLCPE